MKLEIFCRLVVGLDEDAMWSRIGPIAWTKLKRQVSVELGLKTFAVSQDDNAKQVIGVMIRSTEHQKIAAVDLDSMREAIFTLKSRLEAKRYDIPVGVYLVQCYS